MALTQIVYVSSAKASFGKPEVLELLRTSRLNNERAGLTGILLYKDGNFLQVLEGEGAAVQALFEKISADPRHGGVLRLLKSEIAAREFPDWSMAFRDLRDEALPSAVVYLSKPWSLEEVVTAALVALHRAKSPDS